MLDLDTSLREIRRLDAELAAARAETAKLRAEIETMRPVFVASLALRKAELAGEAAWLAVCDDLMARWDVACDAVQQED